MSSFENSKKDCEAKTGFIVSWKTKKISNKDYEHSFKVCNTFEMKTTKIITTCI